MANIRVCTRCVMNDASDQTITFDEDEFKKIMEAPAHERHDFKMDKVASILRKVVK